MAEKPGVVKINNGKSYEELWYFIIISLFFSKIIYLCKWLMCKH